MLDLLSPAFRADPYGHYTQLRQNGRFSQLSAGLWLVHRYDDVTAVLTSPDMANQLLQLLDAPNLEKYSYLAQLQQQWQAYHALSPASPLRRLTSKALPAHFVQNLRPHAQRIADRLLDKAATGKMDLVADLAQPLPIMLLLDLLDVPNTDRPAFPQWIDDVITAVDSPQPELRLQRGNWAARALLDAFQELAMARRKSPQDDFVSLLLDVTLDDDRLSVEEAASICLLLTLTSCELAADLTGNGLLALLQERAQQKMLRKNLELVATAVTEFLRYDSPLQLVVRVALKPVTINGQTIGAGETALALLGAANRDPACYAQADRLDITRDDAGTAVIGDGIYQALALPLARMVSEVAIGAVNGRFPKMRLASNNIQRRPRTTLRGVASLPVTW